MKTTFLYQLWPEKPAAEKGAMGMATSIFIVAILSIFGLILANMQVQTSQRAASSYALTQALYIAESGIRYAYTKSMNGLDQIDSTEANNEDDKVILTHIPPGNPSQAHTICVGRSAVEAHLAHGDYLGTKEIDYGANDPWTWSQNNIPIEGGFADVTVQRTRPMGDTVLITALGKFGETATKIERTIRFIDYLYYASLTTGDLEDVVVEDETEQADPRRKCKIKSNDRCKPKMDHAKLCDHAVKQTHYFDGNLTVAQNSTYPPGEDDFYYEPIQGEVIPGELDESELEFAYMAEGRIGNVVTGSSTHEIDLGRSNSGPFYYGQTSNFQWQSGVAYPFSLTYDGNDDVYFSINGTAVTYEFHGNEDVIERIFVRARSQSNTSIVLDNFVLNNTTVDDTLNASASAGTVNVLQIAGGNLKEGFTLTGRVKMTFPTSGTNRPTNSSLAFQIKVGKDNTATQNTLYKKPLVTWINGDLTLNKNSKIRGIVVCNGRVTMNQGCEVDGIVYARNESQPSSYSMAKSCKVKGGFIGHCSLTGHYSGTSRVCHKRDYVASFYQYVVGYLPSSVEWISWKQY
ncbi:hypothetical protein K1X84_06650 [bacterium]|nr:hypothetical protein [bacterium]